MGFLSDGICQLLPLVFLIDGSTLRRGLWGVWCIYLYAQGVEFDLPAQWSLFAVDEVYNLYGWSGEERALYKVWAPKYDSLTRIGGVPGEEGFLGITALAPLGNQQLYVLDADGQKVFLLGTNLQPLQRLTYAQLPPEVSEGYPVLLAGGSGGELYLLLRESQEIVKVDAFGRVLLRFGGKVYGPGSLAGVVALYAESDRVYVVDTAQRRIVEYDTWGNFIGEEHIPAEVHGAIASRAGKAFWRGNQIIWRNGGEKQFLTSEPIRALWIRKQRLYWVGRHRGGWFPIP
ncbi:MAG: hypothetical protein NZZ60_02490 [Bacteroidia bacterium]|nr:hypothetical protein [Bacteroidia bacterium]MCX7652213.1 hypothetical protein [Bacteroidia bacterium]MDW8416475.1 hypothetical protein [Bacteroidia bacterium]